MTKTGRFYLAAIVSLIFGLAFGLLPTVGPGCGSALIAGDNPAATCEIARSANLPFAVAFLATALVLWVVGIGRLGWSEDRS